MNNNTNYSNYEDLGLRDAQLIMASILKDVKKICDKHNIRYFLDAGTLIGQLDIKVLYHGMTILILECLEKIIINS